MYGLIHVCYVMKSIWMDSNATSICALMHSIISSYCELAYTPAGGSMLLLLQS